MVQLIHKGGFRERANRSKRYQLSENQKTALVPHQYKPEMPQSETTINKRVVQDDELLEQGMQDITP